MMNWLGVAILVAGFVLLIRLFRLVPRSKAVISLATQSAAVIRNPALSDRQKERQLQKATVQLFQDFLIILAGSSIALAAPAAVVWLLDFYDLLSFQQTLALTLSWPFITGISLIGVLIWWRLRLRSNHGL